MIALTEDDIRSSFVNASRRERTGATLPAELASTDWDGLDYLGWRDPKIPGRAYAVVPLDGGPVGILFRQAEAPAGLRMMCAWCEDVWLSSEVVFYGAKRSGASGRQGNTMGTYLCRDFQCSENVRRDPPLPYKGYDLDAARQGRIEQLQLRVAAFAERL
ncbi:FBP domain-containing protein [Citricoccus sp. SGAir0253]|uniref:FBP domain-containing protein n=1 Tax=Citricoccus sp. SGAir0253 TaxID=2567881 RepID=UPI0010CCD457|nr:FBP domain-containing protein [Citricoccus sp. SGAir0253]QCU77183.1 FBP domain-containing protein [Citricoccus sp. SGAir0253]